MPIVLTEDQWDFVDEMLRLNTWLMATVFIRDSTACRLNDAFEAVGDRRQAPGADFSSSVCARVAAFIALNKVADPIRVIEGS